MFIWLAKKRGLNILYVITDKNIVNNLSGFLANKTSNFSVAYRQIIFSPLLNNTYVPGSTMFYLSERKFTYLSIQNFLRLQRHPDTKYFTYLKKPDMQNPT